MAVLAAGGWYAHCLRRLRRSGGEWPARRAWSFLTGQLMVLIGLSSGLIDFAQQNFSAYVSLYVAVALVAPALMVLGAPLELGRSVRAPGVARLLSSRALRVATFPLAAWVLFAASMFVLYFTAVFGATLESSTYRQLVYLGLVMVGFLFHWPIARLDPIPWPLRYAARAVYTLLVFPVYGILGMTLESQTGRISPGISLASLHLGGAVVWVAGETLALYAAIAVFVQWLSDDERAARRRDADHEAAAARQLALWRASRDAAARAASRST